MNARYSIAASLAATLLTSVLPSSAAAQDRIFAIDSSASMAVPGGFFAAPLNESALLQFADTSGRTFVLLIHDNREDVPGWSLATYSMTTTAQLLTSLRLPEVSSPEPFVLDGHPAIRYRIRGGMDDMDLAYLQVAVETPETFAMLVGWSLASDWQASEATIHDIMESLRFHGPVDGVSADMHAIVPGTWAWDNEPEACTGTVQRFELAEDGRSMRIRHSEPYEAMDGTMTDVTEYVVEEVGPGYLATYIPGETRLTDDGVPVKWDLVAVGRNRLAWHRTDWEPGHLTAMLRRCDAPQ